MSCVLVTGAAGFIGGHFVQACREKKYEDIDNVVAYDKISYASDPRMIRMFKEWSIDLYTEDVANISKMIEAISANNVKIVVHFAAETHVDNSIRNNIPFIDSNIRGTQGVLEACRATKAKLIHVSTDEVYGPAQDDGFLETDRLNPTNPYSATKAAAEHLVTSYANTFGLEYLIVRPSNNYGPRQHLEKFIPKYISNVLRGKPFPLYGDGSQIREWFYVKDNARMIRELAIKFDRDEIGNEILNLGRMGTSISNIVMCQLLHKHMNAPVEFRKTIDFVDDRPGHDKIYAINTSKVMRILPKFEFTEFDQSLKECIDYYRGP